MQFGASGGVARPTVCADFQPFAPVRAVVETPACRQAAASLAASLGDSARRTLKTKRLIEPTLLKTGQETYEAERVGENLKIFVK